MAGTEGQRPGDDDRRMAEDLGRRMADGLDRPRPTEPAGSAGAKPEDARRTDRLRRRRRTARERRQALVLYAVAALVAFGAVLGAWWVGSMLLGDEEVAEPTGHLTLLTLTADTGDPVAAALVVKDAATSRYALFVIPRELLLQGPNGEYVFAADSMATGDLRADLERVIDAKVDAAYTLPLSTLGELAGTDVLQVQLARPVTVIRDGAKRTYEDQMVIVKSDIPELMATSGSGGYDSTTIQEGIWAAVLDAAASSSGSSSPVPFAAATAASGTADHWYLEDSLRGLPADTTIVARIPSTSRVAEGQFAFLPDREGIMASITRRRTGYQAKYTVVVRNGTGKVGAGAAVVDALSGLDVNLPEPTNADRFNYRRTRIIAGSGALTVAEDIRAILGRGVMLNGADIPSDTVVVIVGDDLHTEDLNPKDKP